MANILGFGSQNTKLHTSFSTTLPASDWTNGTLEIHDPSLFATGQYDYLIGPAPASRDEYTACAVWAERLAGDGKLLFRCETDPESDLSVQVLRFETPDADIARVFNAEGGGGGGGNMQNRLEALETTVGNDAAGLVKNVTENTADLTALQSDVSEVQQQQTAQDAAISGNTAAISNVSERVSAAQTAANNAQETADEAKSGLDGKLPLSGGTMTGAITGGTPHDSMYIQHLYEGKSYYVARFSFGQKNNTVFFGYGDDSYEITDTTDVHPVKVDGISTPYSPYEAANKKYVDSKIVFGYYYGNGNTDKTKPTASVNLGFEPKTIIVAKSGIGVYSSDVGEMRMYSKSFNYPMSTQKAVEFTSSGFNLYNSIMSVEDTGYYYIAFK